MKRFGFGSNWESYARHALNAERVGRAREDFSVLLQKIELADRSFLDIGFGQGLTAAIAAEGGARVTAVDVDPDCRSAYSLTREFFPGSREPEIVIGSVLDPGVIAALHGKGPYDVVHSWGVLHHTGDMWRALEVAASMVKPGGHFVLAIYASHWSSHLWRVVKWTYVHAPRLLRRAMVAAFYPLMLLRAWQLGADRVMTRGMEFRHDLVDWVGGYPYEWASREEIESYLGARNLVPVRFRPTLGMTGCHEYVFQRPAA